jgi:hypothetical protein
MNTYPTTERLSADRSTRVIGATVLAAAIVLLRGLAYGVYILLAAAEPFLAVVLGTLALGCFWVAVIFGFVLKEPFAQRWHVLGASVVFILIYVVYRFIMRGVQRVMR